MKTFLKIRKGLGAYQTEELIEVEKETKCYWFHFPYKFNKKTKREVHGGVTVIKVIEIIGNPPARNLRSLSNCDIYTIRILNEEALLSMGYSPNQIKILKGLNYSQTLLSSNQQTIPPLTEQVKAALSARL